MIQRETADLENALDFTWEIWDDIHGSVHTLS